MNSKFPRAAMNLKQWLMRQEVLKLYRDIHRALRRVPDDKTRNELREWVRTDFRKNMQINLTDDFTIKNMLNHGKKSLHDLQNSLALSSTSDAQNSVNAQNQNSTVAENSIAAQNKE